MDRLKLRASLELAEGNRAVVYDDATGQPITKGSTLVGYPTIGIGHLLTKPMSEVARRMLLSDDIQEAIDGLDTHFQEWRRLDDVRQRVLIEMSFNIGITKLMKFQRTLQAVRIGDWHAAADHMADSKWAREDVPGRAKRLGAMMRNGKDPE